MAWLDVAVVEEKNGRRNPDSMRVIEYK